MTKETLNHRIKMLSELHDGWSGMNSLAPKQETITMVKEYIEEYGRYDSMLADIYPTGKGSIVLEYRKDNLYGTCLNVEFGSDIIEYVYGREKTRRMPIEKYMSLRD